MEINGISGIGVGGAQESAVSRESVRLKSSTSSRLDTRHSVEHERGSRSHRHDHDHGHRRGRGLGILRQEIRQALTATFRLNFAASLPAYNANSGGESPEAVADDALSAARQLAARSPLEARNSLVELRGEVEQAANSARQTIGDDDNREIEDAIGRVSEGLDDLDDDAARNVESSASVLSVETRLRQRSTIRIRTQEGDIVRFDLRRAERMSATDIAVADGDNSFTSTQVEVSSRTRSVLKVEGDLNEAELAAIEKVFAQAEAIADEFFGGDLAAAFDLAAGLEYDTEQLSRVKMRFREKQVSNISYAAIQTTAPQPTPQPKPIESIATTDPVSGPEPVIAEAPTTVADVTPEVAATQVVEPEVVAEPPAVANDAIAGFAQMLSNFLQAVNEGFEIESGSQRFYYSESFRLEILKSVLQVSAPEESGEAPSLAAAMIDAVSEADD